MLAPKNTNAIGSFAMLAPNKKMLPLTRRALIQRDLNARVQPNAFYVGGDLNALNLT